MKPKMKYAVSAFCLCSFVLYAAASEVREKLLWPLILKRGLEKNSSLAAASEELERARLEYKSAALEFMPNLSGSASWSNPSDSEESYGLGLSASVPLFKGFRNRAGYSRKYFNYKAREASYKNTEREVIYNLKMAYAGVLKSSETVKLAAEFAERRKNNMELVKLRYEAGREDIGASLRSDADYFEAVYELSSAVRATEMAELDLARVMGEESLGGASVVGALDGIFPEAGSSIAPEKSVEDLLAADPEYLQACYEYEAVLETEKSAKGKLYPELSFSARLGRTGGSFPPGSPRWSAGLSLNYPFLSSGKDVLSVRIARSAVAESEEKFRDVRRRILRDMKEARYSLLDAAGKLDVKKKYFAAASARARIAKEKYLNGLISYEDWDAIEKELINMRKSVLEAVYGRFRAEALGEKLFGETK